MNRNDKNGVQIKQCHKVIPIRKLLNYEVIILILL